MTAPASHTGVPRAGSPRRRFFLPAAGAGRCLFCAVLRSVVIGALLGATVLCLAAWLLIFCGAAAIVDLVGGLLL